MPPDISILYSYAVTHYFTNCFLTQLHSFVFSHSLMMMPFKFNIDRLALVYYNIEVQVQLWTPFSRVVNVLQTIDQNLFLVCEGCGLTYTDLGYEAKVLLNCTVD